MSKLEPASSVDKLGAFARCLGPFEEPFASVRKRAHELDII